MIVRDLEAATRREFDLVVVGGGIYGVSLLQEAARRGLSVCLCEAGDFGGGTSWNSLRIVHGGLRYLQSMHLRRFFQSVAARRRMAQQFPALVRPLDCLMPLYGQGMRRVSLMRMALLANDLLSARRNAGVVESVRLAGGQVLDAVATQRAFPGVRADGLEGAACWTDYCMVSSERIVIELLHDACRNGAIALNYTPVVEIVSEGNVARGVRVRDVVADEIHTIAARSVVNCAGPHLRNLARGRGGDAERLFLPSLAFNVLLDLDLPTSRALAVTAPQHGAPTLFVLPQQGALLAGTMHLPRPAEATDAVATEAELAQFLGQLNAAVPRLHARPENIRRVFAGLLPAVAACSSTLLKREMLMDHGKAGGVERLFSVSGVKFTTAHEVACQALAMMGFAGAGTAEDVQLHVSPWTELLTNAAQFLRADPGVAESAAKRVIEEESVQCQDDLIFRRTSWGATETDLERVRARVAQCSKLPAQSPGGPACW